MKQEELYAVALSVCSSPSMNQIWDSIAFYESRDLYNRLLKNKPVTQPFIQSKYPADPESAAKEICNICHLKNIKIITYWDKDYPKFLKEISKPPVVLYCIGNYNHEKTIAIVGTRKADKKSMEIARRLSIELSAAGFTIVSGMAIGIDREAHIGALKNNGSTIGILANGIDIAYPSSNRDVYSAIVKSQKSSLISEYPPGILAGQWTFVRRNRIISGMSLGTVIVKAAAKSGALITANHAIEQNREVFACPGNAFDISYSGCHDLIKNGAVLVSDTEDILKEFSNYEDRIIHIKEKASVIKKEIQIKPAKLSKREDMVSKYPLNSIENKILNILSSGESDIDSLMRSLDYGADQVNEAVMLLELANEISRVGNLISKT